MSAIVGVERTSTAVQPAQYSLQIGPRIFPGFVRQLVPICAGFGLAKCRASYKKSLILLRFGRIAQRESVPFTRERSKVRSLVRPPCLSEACPTNRHSGAHRVGSLRAFNCVFLAIAWILASRAFL